MKQRQLVARDSALAALMGGLVGGDFGGEFGGFGDEVDMGDDDMGDDYGEDDDVGGDFGAARRRVVRRPTAQAAAAAHRKLSLQKQRHNNRVAKLDPNMGSPTKIERYSFSLSQDFTLGTTAAFNTNMSGTPDTKFRPQIITINAPAPGFALISNIKMANVNVTVGPGSEDAFNYASQGWGRSLDMPTLTPSNRATVSGSYTGYVPPGYVAAAAYTLSVNFKGPSLLAGGSSD